MRKITIYLSMLLSLALIATACVSDSEDTTDTTAAAAPETTVADTPDTTEGDTTEATEGTVEPAGPVLIGSIHPLTGGLAGAGNRMDNGARMAVEEINAAGGIASLGGAPLELVSADSTGAAEVGQSEAERLIGEGVSALIGTYQSAVTTNVAAIAERDGVPLVIDVAVADSILDQGYTSVFRIQPNATSMGANGALFLNELAGDEIQTVAYLHDDTGFGVSVADAFEAAAADYGIEVTARVPYPPFEVTDLTTEMSQAAAVSPDVIVITGYYNDGLLAARAATDLEVDVKAVVGIAQGAFHTPQFVADFGADAELFFNSNYHFDASDPVVQGILEKFETAYGEPMDTEAMLSYQAIYVIADALERAASADPADVRAALAETNIADHFMAYPGPIAFDADGENTGAQPVLMQVIEGAVQQVYPIELREADPVFPGTAWSSN
ncbi:MAG: ABC transporter substrate-binding protein [Acidimicrobiia bacterium]|nr:ABC transporter substrate-binding protein [Acidimicrobiia bacterium]